MNRAGVQVRQGIQTGGLLHIRHYLDDSSEFIVLLKSVANASQLRLDFG